MKPHIIMNVQHLSSVLYLLTERAKSPIQQRVHTCTIICSPTGISYLHLTLPRPLPSCVASRNMPHGCHGYCTRKFPAPSHILWVDILSKCEIKRASVQISSFHIAESKSDSFVHNLLNFWTPDTLGRYNV